MKFIKENKGKLISLAIILVFLFCSYFFTDVPDKKTEEIPKQTVLEEASVVVEEVAEEPEKEEKEEKKEVEEEEKAPAEVKEEKPTTEAEKIQEENDDVEISFQGKKINKETGLDEYETEPVPEGRPAPIEPQTVTISDKQLNCTISIRCDTILNNIDKLEEAKWQLIPQDGVILAEKSVTFYEGESVFNVLLRETRKNGIHMEYVNTPIYNSAYIEGINNLYEFDCGELSGWMYSVNGWFPNYGCSRYALKEGDRIEWVFTCNLGKDVK